MQLQQVNPVVMYRTLFFLLLLTNISLFSFAQDPSYKHYTVQDGLPGATVYQSLQDKNGYIWFATSQGLSRFDGKNFRNFYKEDGLPDNEILKMHLDQHNNIWFVSLTGVPAVFYKGAFHKLGQYAGVISIHEDLAGDSIHLISKWFSGIKPYYGYHSSPNNTGAWNFQGMVSDNGRLSHEWPVFATSARGNRYFFSAQNGQHLITVQRGGYVNKFVVYHDIQHGLFPWSLKSMFTTTNRGSLLFCTDTLFEVQPTGVKALLPLAALQIRYVDVNSMYYENDSTLWFSTRTNGLLRIQDFRSDRRRVQTFFPNDFCTSLLKDREGGFWVTTHNSGVYYLPDLQLYTSPGSHEREGQNAGCLVAIHSNYLAAGFTGGTISLIDRRTLQRSPLPGWQELQRNNRIMDIKFYGNSLFVASDYYLQKVMADGTNKKVLSFSAGSIKELFITTDSTIVMATSQGIRLKISHEKYSRVIHGPRATCVNGIGNDFYWGTPSGLYAVVDDSVRYLGTKHPLLRGNINHIDIGADSSFWVSTEQGLVIQRNGVFSSIGKQNGLASNISKHVLLDDGIAWVSTDKGISKITYHWKDNKPVYTLYNINENDGLASSNVNRTALCVTHIAVATDRGVCFIPKDYVPQMLPAPLININSIINGDQENVTDDTVIVNYKKNKLLIHLSGISFRSGKQLAYQYRFKHLDSNWTTSPTDLIEFSTLPFGNYVFEVRAIDRWGNKSSAPKEVVIMVPPPFWKKNWFIYSSYCLTALLVGCIVFFFLYQQQRRQEKAYRVQKRLADMELMALKAQVNPHFIFNCLSSIQHYILKADTLNANLYLHKFSTLMRKILHLSATQDLTLAEEVQILTSYLELEKLRLGKRMEYVVHVSPDLAPENIYLPPMIIQPYVENAVKHGIALLQDRSGLVSVTFSAENNYLVCVVEDNGVGIEGSVATFNLSGQQQPSGNSINRSKINVINSMQKDKILLEVTNKKYQHPPGYGTIITLKFPL